MADDTSTGDARTDGGAVHRSEKPRTPIDRLRTFAGTELGVVIGVAAATLVLPFLLVDVLGMVADATGFAIDGYEGLASLVLIFGIVVVGFNILLGYVKLLSFGHAAFFGVAAYVAVLMASTYEVTPPGIEATVTMPGVGSPLAMVLAGAVAATLLAWVIGFLSIRRSGVYFAVLTLTFGQMLYFFALEPGSWLTNGDDGFGTGSTSFSVEPLFGVFDLGQRAPIPSAEWSYLFIAGLTVVAVAVAHRILNSPYGLIFEALGQNEQRVAFVGLDVFRYKLMSFIISGTFAGVGGALFAIHESYIHPNRALYWITSGDFVIMSVLGGVGTLVGPIFGALLFEYINNVVRGFVGGLWRLVLGVAFVLVVWTLPEGLWGAIRGSLAKGVTAAERVAFEESGDAESPRQGDDD
jgi:branched-chain amino acid transport system permease protein